MMTTWECFRNGQNLVGLVEGTLMAAVAFCALFPPQLPSHPIAPSSKHADSKPVPLTPAYHTLPHPSHHGTPHTTINWGPLEPPKTPKPWSLSCLRPAPPLRPSAALCYKEVRSERRRV